MNNNDGRPVKLKLSKMTCSWGRALRHSSSMQGDVFPKMQFIFLGPLANKPGSASSSSPSLQVFLLPATSSTFEHLLIVSHQFNLAIVFGDSPLHYLSPTLTSWHSLITRRGGGGREAVEDHLSDKSGALPEPFDLPFGTLNAEGTKDGNLA